MKEYKEYSAFEIIDTFVNKFPKHYEAMNSVKHSYKNGNTVNPYHAEGTVWTHTMMVLQAAREFNGEYGTQMMLTALCHDIGKAYHYEDVEGNPKGKHEVQRMDRRRFNNHESMSFFYAKDVLKEFDISEETKNRILITVASHGDLYGYFDEEGIPSKFWMDIAKKFDSTTFTDLKNFYSCDVKGRISTDDRSKLDKVLKDMGSIEDYIQIIEVQRKETEINDKTLTLLVGPPRVGKSTYLSQVHNKEVVVSRDNTLMKYGHEKYGSELTYNEIWVKLDTVDHKNIDEEVRKTFVQATKNGKDIVVDMTNMSKKSRRKWVNDPKVKDYHKQAIVFCESPDTLLNRKEEGKNIPEYVTYNFMKAFSFPKLDEFDAVGMFVND